MPGSHEATQVFFVGFQRGLDDGGLKLKPSPKTPPGRCLLPLGLLLPPQTPGQTGPCRKTHDPTRPPPVPGVATLLRFCLGWCQISYHPARCPRSASTLVLNRCRPLSKTAMVESSKFPLPQTLGSGHKPPSPKRRFRNQRTCSKTPTIRRDRK